MFERFTEAARQVVVLAQDEARALRHNYIGTEHLLLGLLRGREGIAARTLESLDIALEDVRAQVVRIIGQGDEVTGGQIPFTPRSKLVLELALREALSLGHNYIGPEHVLLGLVVEGEGVASRILLDLGVDNDAIRTEVVRILSGADKDREPYEPKSPPVAQEVVDEIASIAKEKQEALEQHAFDRVAELRSRERMLVRAARGLESAWTFDPAAQPTHEPSPSEFYGSHGRVLLPRMPSVVRLPRRSATYGERVRPELSLLAGWVLFAIALGIGILVGWAIWT